MKVEVQGLLYKDVREVPVYGNNNELLKPFYQFTLKVQRTRPYNYDTKPNQNTKKVPDTIQEVSYDLVEVTYKYDNGSQLKELAKGEVLKVVGYGSIQPEYEGRTGERKVVTRAVVTPTGSFHIPVTKLVIRAQKVSRVARPSGVIEMEPQMDPETGDFDIAVL
jgi:hypothetical protein